MNRTRLVNLYYLATGVIIGLVIIQWIPSSSMANQQSEPVYEYAYAHGILETEGDPITLYTPELETVESDWGPIEVYKKIEYPIAFEGGASGTEMWAINQIAAEGWVLVCKYYVNEGHEKGHHYWFRRVKQ